MIRKDALMYKVLIFAAVLGCLAPGAAQSQSEVLSDPRELTFEELKFDVPRLEKVTLGNGMGVYMLADRSLPVVRFYAAIRTGEIYEPARKAGLAALTGSLIRDGGTKNIPSDELNRTLDEMAASVEVGISREMGTATMFVLAKDLQKRTAWLQLFPKTYRIR